MPECRGITVNVTDVSGQSLQEWGVQHINLKQQGRRVSAYIQSTTDAMFQISLQPRIPWCDRDHPYSDDPDDWPGDRRRERFDAKIRAKNTGVPPYAFLAALYLDGRMQPERKAIIFTDPDDSDFERPDGKVLLRHRMVHFKDGRIIEYGWAFKEKAIELVFDKLNLGDQQKVSDEAALVNALLSSQLSAADEDQDKHRVGQILVEIRRVKVGPSYIDRKYKTRFKEGQDDDVDTRELQGDITHRTGFVRKGTLSRYEVENPRIVQYRSWKPGEGVYASFLFFYRSRDQLAKFGFPGFPPLPNAARKDRRFLHNTFSSLTPFGISKQAESASNQAKAKPESFEDKVRKRKSSCMSADAQISAQSDKSLISQLRSFANTGETSKSIATLEASNSKTLSKITVPLSLPPSSQNLNKNRLEKLASQNPKPITDDEADVDVSEPNTESDLESLPGDEMIPTDPNPDEADESHERLREQLGGIEIRKWSDDEVDQKLERRTAMDRVASLGDIRRELKPTLDALDRALGVKAVKNEDDDEETPNKRIKSETAYFGGKEDDI